MWTVGPGGALSRPQPLPRTSPGRGKGEGGEVGVPVPPSRPGSPYTGLGPTAGSRPSGSDVDRSTERSGITSRGDPPPTLPSPTYRPGPGVVSGSPVVLVETTILRVPAGVNRSQPGSPDYDPTPVIPSPVTL